MTYNVHITIEKMDMLAEKNKYSRSHKKLCPMQGVDHFHNSINVIIGSFGKCVYHFNNVYFQLPHKIHVCLIYAYVHFPKILS